MTDETSEDGGVLENLPRTRPGTRSSKRATGSPAKSSARAAKKTEATGRAAAKPAPGARAKRPSRTKPVAEEPAPPAPERGDPVSDLIRAGTKLAGTGVRVADSLAREVLRRLPRP